MIVLGVDPGLSGGLALLDWNGQALPRLIDVADVPTIGQDAKRRVRVPAVLRFLQQCPIDHAFIERAQARPADGGSSAFIYGRSTGYLEALIVGMQIRLCSVETVCWKRKFGVMRQENDTDSMVKRRSLEYARRLFGGDPFPLAGDHNKAESALIGWYGAQSTMQNNFSGIHVIYKR